MDRDKKDHKYKKLITNEKGEAIVVDVYDILKAFAVTCPAMQHLIKKALNLGIRGHKGREQDAKDILSAALRGVDLNKGEE